MGTFGDGVSPVYSKICLNTYLQSPGGPVEAQTGLGGPTFDLPAELCFWLWAAWSLPLTPAEVSELWGSGTHCCPPGKHAAGEMLYI